jgi:cytochrome c553
MALIALGFCATALAQTDEARAKKIISSSCFICHGDTGVATSELFPRLAGQHHEYIAKQLENFKSGTRKSSAMREMAAKLTSDDMLALGKYFEKQSIPIEIMKDAELATVGKTIFHNGNKHNGLPACASCHGSEGRGSGSMPRLAGQYAGYIETQLKQFNARERTNDNEVMHTIVVKMTPLEISAVAEYLSTK